MLNGKEWSTSTFVKDLKLALFLKSSITILEIISNFVILFVKVTSVAE